MSRTFYHSIILLTGCILWVGCKKTPPPSIPESFALPSGQGAFICNEGNFQWSNASLSYVDLEKDTIYQSPFQAVHGKGLGDVLQSAGWQGDSLWMVVNNSGKIICVNSFTMDIYTTISGLKSPRYIVPVPHLQKAFVSDLYANGVHVVDLQKATVSGKIPMQGATGEMVLSAGVLWVKSQKDPFVKIISPANEAIVDSLFAGKGNAWFEIDVQGRLWVLTNGGSDVAHLTLIDPVQRQVIRQWAFSTGQSPDYLACDEDGNAYYLMNNKVFSQDANSATLSKMLHFSPAALTIYGMEVDPYGQGIWILDAKDYVQPGTATLYTLNGDSIQQFTTGIIPNSMVFRN